MFPFVKVDRSLRERLLSAIIKRFPKDKGGLHTPDDVNEARKDLQRAGVVWSFRDETYANIDVIPGETAAVIRRDLAGQEAIFAAGGTPFIAPKSNTTGGAGGLLGKMVGYYTYRQDEFMPHYHKRSNVESTFSMVKRKFGDSIRGRTDVAMRNEVYAKILCHNLCCVILSQCELGIEPMFWKEPATA